ncbi:unnamed protein product, partial [Ectocarpus sp. 13 AM-2016]
MSKSAQESREDTPVLRGDASVDARAYGKSLFAGETLRRSQQARSSGFSILPMQAVLSVVIAVKSTRRSRQILSPKEKVQNHSHLLSRLWFVSAERLAPQAFSTRHPTLHNTSHQ